jgi:hypothetical protein
MALSKEPFDAAFAPDSEFESANAGWDPYVASLLGGKTGNKSGGSGTEKKPAPVMTITRRIANALLNKKR